MSLGPDDIASDGEGDAALKPETIEQDVHMSDAPSAVCDTPSRVYSALTFFSHQKNKKKADEIMEDELDEDDSPPVKQQKVKDDRKLVRRFPLFTSVLTNTQPAIVQKE